MAWKKGNKFWDNPNTKKARFQKGHSVPKDWIDRLNKTKQLNREKKRGCIVGEVYQKGYKFLRINGKYVREHKYVWVNESDIRKLPKNAGDERMYEWLDNYQFFMGVIKHKGKEVDELGTFVDYLP